MTLRVIDMANMAFALSSIPLKLADGGFEQYGGLESFIENQYRELTGLDKSISEILRDGRMVNLPAIKPIPPGKLREYYERTIKQLAQAA